MEIDGKDIHFENLKIPEIARGTIIPRAIENMMAEEEQRKKDKRRERWKFIFQLLFDIFLVLLGFALGKWF